ISCTNSTSLYLNNNFFFVLNYWCINFFKTIILWGIRNYCIHFTWIMVCHINSPLKQLFLVCFSRSEEHTSELQSRFDLVCRLLLFAISPLFPYTTLFRSISPAQIPQASTLITISSSCSITGVLTSSKR